MARAIIKCLKLTVTVIGNCITIGWCISISLRINSDSYCLSVRLSTVTVFCTGIILSYPFEITDSLTGYTFELRITPFAAIIPPWTLFQNVTSTLYIGQTCYIITLNFFIKMYDRGR